MIPFSSAFNARTNDDLSHIASSNAYYSFSSKTASLRVHFAPSLKNTKIPFLFPTTISGMPSPLISRAMTCVPTPELSSILCGMKRAGPLSRCSSNQ